MELVKYYYEQESYTICIHFCLFALQNNLSPSLYNAFISASFAGIAKADRLLQRFRSTNVGATSGNLKSLQDGIFNTRGSYMDGLSTYFLNKIPVISGDDYAFAQMMYDIDVNEGNAALQYRKFSSAFPKSKYNLVINTKTK